MRSACVQDICGARQRDRVPVPNSVMRRCSRECRYRRLFVPSNTCQLEGSERSRLLEVHCERSALVCASTDPVLHLLTSHQVNELTGVRL